MAVKEKAVVRSYEGIPPKIEKLTEELSCELNNVEWDNRARELADSIKKHEQESQRKKDVMKEIGADVNKAAAQVTKLGNIVSTRREQRDVTVQVKYDYELGTVTKTRTDTDEVISSREMTTLERQSGLFDNDAAVDANELIEGRHEEEDSTNETDSEEE
jgi:hypothetical protein